LIEGAAEPAAPDAGGDQMSVLGLSDAAGDAQPVSTAVASDERIAAARDAGRSAASQPAAVVAQQAELAVAMVAPLSPVYLAVTARAAGEAIAGALAADAARGEVFSRWGRNESDGDRVDTEDVWSQSLNAVPLLAVLALERFVATKRKRNECTAENSRPLKRARRDEARVDLVDARRVRDACE
jgi:hypothetical protein